MIYIIPAALAVSFDFSDAPYIAGEPAFYFGEGQGVVIIYPEPPTRMVSSGIGITLPGGSPAAKTLQQYSGKPSEKSTRRSLDVVEAAQQFDARLRQGWDRLNRMDDAGDTVAHSWDQPPPKWPAPSSQPWDKTASRDDNGRAQSWDGSIKPTDAVGPHNWIQPPAKDEIRAHHQADSAKFWEMPVVIEQGPPTGYHPGSSAMSITEAPYLIPGYDALDFNLRIDEYTPPVPVIVPTRPIDTRAGAHAWEANTPTDIRYRHPWDDKPRQGTELVWEYDQEPPLPDKPPAPDPEIKEAYLYMNASSLKKMPEGIPLEFADLSMTLDIDSFSWGISCTILNDESMAQIKPGPAGPVEIEVRVNNKTWRFMVERYSLQQQFPKRTYRISGSGLVQLLAEPYSAKASAQIDTPTNALQVAQAVLTNTGFTIDWDVSLADYTIPAGAWGYQDKAPIEVIDELVKAAGGIIVPGLSNSTIYAKQRYREAPPWYWPDLDVSSLDFQVADSTILSLSSEWQPTPEYNGVYISGISAGVAVDVLRSGTDGTPRAADVYDALNLTTQQCRGRGIAILGQSGAQEIVTIELPIPTSGAPGLVIPGQFGEIQDTNTPANSWRCLVLSNTVKVSKPGASRATQTLKLERHHY